MALRRSAAETFLDSCRGRKRRLSNLRPDEAPRFRRTVSFHRTHSGRAERLSNRARSTFDGVHTTSGYHLPWALVLAAVSRIAGVVTLDKTAHLFAHLAVATSIMVATVLRWFSSPLARACALVLFVSTFSLTEMVLAAPILLALLERVADDAERGGPRSLDARLALALPLLRVDLACAVLGLYRLSAPRCDR